MRGRAELIQSTKTGNGQQTVKELEHHREPDQIGRATVEFAQPQVAFPGFENDLNAPPQPVNPGNDLGSPDLGPDIGDKQAPIHELETLASGDAAPIMILFG